MINEIKNYKLQAIQDKLSSYKQIAKEIKELEEQIINLESECEKKSKLIPYKNFNWVQKHITQRNEYKNYTRENKDISLLQEKIAQLRNRKYERYYQMKKIDKVALEEQASKIRRGKKIIRLRF